MRLPSHMEQASPPPPDPKCQAKPTTWDWDRFVALAESAGFKAKRNKHTDGSWWQIFCDGDVEVAHVSVNDFCCAFHVKDRRPAEWDSDKDRPFRQDEFDEMFRREFAAQIAAHAANHQADPHEFVDLQSGNRQVLTPELAERLAELYARCSVQMRLVRMTIEEINRARTGD